MEAIIYKEYTIQATETSEKRWRAEIRRIDGQKIKTATGEEFDVLPTGGMEEFSAESAIDKAKGLIDRGNLSAGSKGEPINLSRASEATRID